MLTEKLTYLNLTNPKPAILVVGDLMIDHYVTGSADRLSPEAPVPVVDVKQESRTLGGAGNVVQNLISLGANISVGGITGNDRSGQHVAQLLAEDGVTSEYILQEDGRVTTLKTRVLAGGHQLLRIDKENRTPILMSTEDRLADILQAPMHEADMVIFSDYNKGLFAGTLAPRLIAMANEAGKKVIIDPKGKDYRKYKGAYLIKPNRSELAQAAGTGPITNTDEIITAAGIVLDQTNATYLVVTLSEEGIAIITKDSYTLLPVKATEVFDVTGAGDTVLASIAYFLTIGLTIEESCELANHAAAIVIRQVGSATVTIDQILADITRSAQRTLQDTN